MQIYPEKYDKLNLSTSERSFLRTMERSFPGDQLAYYVLQINPRKRDAGKGQAELFSMLVVPEGIEIADPQVVSKSYPHFWEDLKKAGFIIIDNG